MTSSSIAGPMKVVPNPFPLLMNDNPLLRQTLAIYDNFLTSIVSPTNGSGAKSGNKFFSNIKQTFSNQQANSDDYKNNIGGVFNELSCLDIHRLPTNTTITQITSNRKQFEEESKKYYDFLSKWLAQGYGTSSIDCPRDKLDKLLKRKKAWLLARLTYFDWLYNEVIQVYFSRKLDNDETKIKIKKYLNRSDQPRRELINSIHNVSTCEELDLFLVQISTLEVYDSQLTFVSLNEDLLKFISGISYVVDASTGKLKKANVSSKAGLLFTQHGQKKPGWHKQWVSIYNGKFFEYMDWRLCRNLRNDPLVLGLCNIKLVDSVSPTTSKNEINGSDSIGNRRNCFRIMSNLGVEHVFQSMSSNGIQDWLNCIEIDANFTSSSAAAARRNHPRLKSFTSLASSSNASTKSLESSSITGPRSRRVSSVTSTLLKRVYQNSSSNLKCCDCGSDGPDWVSLNLLVVFCIKCSASHRSLGSSVSKVRSLTLDIFKDEIRYLVERGINNGESNLFWESRLPIGRGINYQTTPELRNDFIKSKYMLHKWTPMNINGTDELQKNIVKAIHDHSYTKILECIVHGYDVNNKMFNPLQYSLRYPIIDAKGKEVFDVSEFLVLNGAIVGKNVDQSLDNSAQKWLQEKIDRLSGPKNNVKPVVLSKHKLAKLITTNIEPETVVKLKSPRDGFNKFKKKMLG